MSEGPLTINLYHTLLISDFGSILDTESLCDNYMFISEKPGKCLPKEI